MSLSKQLKAPLKSVFNSAEQRWSAIITLIITIIAITPLCGFLFQCGCDWPWSGLDSKCNYYNVHTQHQCPWCASITTGIVSTALAIITGVRVATTLPYSLRSENSIIPVSDLSFSSTAALEKQLRSLLCACFPGTSVKPKSCVILLGIIKSSLLSNGPIVTEISIRTVSGVTVFILIAILCAIAATLWQDYSLGIGGIIFAIKAT